MPVLELPRDEVHVHVLRAPAWLDSALEERYLALLTPEERARRARFYFPNGRTQYLLTRVLARVTLSLYADVAPSDWRFAPNAHGRPEIVEPADVVSRSLRFNLSNTEGLQACIVGRERALGVDVEWTERRAEAFEIADRFFSSAEVAELRACPEHARSERFYYYWTLKEAYIKARGAGLSIPLDRFSFSLGAPKITFHDTAELAPAERWQFATHRFESKHILSYALRREPHAPVRALLRELEPLGPTVSDWSRPKLVPFEPLLTSEPTATELVPSV
jgi:4'-phosphopantetheinyl transferase